MDGKKNVFLRRMLGCKAQNADFQKLLSLSQCARVLSELKKNSDQDEATLKKIWYILVNVVDLYFPSLYFLFENYLRTRNVCVKKIVVSSCLTKRCDFLHVNTKSCAK